MRRSAGAYPAESIVDNSGRKTQPAIVRSAVLSHGGLFSINSMARTSVAPRTRVEELMLARGLTQREISERADWHPSTINRIVSGQNAVSAGARRTIARILECSESDLIQPMGSPVPPISSVPLGSNQRPQLFAERLAALLAVSGLQNLEAVARFLLDGDFSHFPTGVAAKLRNELGVPAGTVMSPPPTDET